MESNKIKELNLCNEDCNDCPMILHPNSRMMTYILNKLVNKFGDEVIKMDNLLKIGEVILKMPYTYAVIAGLFTYWMLKDWSLMKDYFRID